MNGILKSSIIAHPSNFVLFSDTRCRSAETPYFGTDANRIILGTPQSYTTRFAARHSKGGNITFSDGHSAFFKYTDIVADGSAGIAAGKDPGNPAVNWDADGNRVL